MPGLTVCREGVLCHRGLRDICTQSTVLMQPTHTLPPSSASQLNKFTPRQADTKQAPSTHDEEQPWPASCLSAPGEGREPPFPFPLGSQMRRGPWEPEAAILWLISGPPCLSLPITRSPSGQGRVHELVQSAKCSVRQQRGEPKLKSYAPAPWNGFSSGALDLTYPLVMQTGHLSVSVGPMRPLPGSKPSCSPACEMHPLPSSSPASSQASCSGRNCSFHLVALPGHLLTVQLRLLTPPSVPRTEFKKGFHILIYVPSSARASR